MLKYFGIDAEHEVDIFIKREWRAKTIQLAVEANAEVRPMTVKGITPSLSRPLLVLRLLR